MYSELNLKNFPTTPFFFTYIVMNVNFRLSCQKTLAAIIQFFERLFKKKRVLFQNQVTNAHSSQSGAAPVNNAKIKGKSIFRFRHRRNA